MLYCLLKHIFLVPGHLLCFVHTGPGTLHISAQLPTAGANNTAFWVESLSDLIKNSEV